MGAVPFYIENRLPSAFIYFTCGAFDASEVQIYFLQCRVGKNLQTSQSEYFKTMREDK
jgi:hypothetical protein